MGIMRLMVACRLSEDLPLAVAAAIGYPLAEWARDCARRGGRALPGAGRAHPWAHLPASPWAHWSAKGLDSAKAHPQALRQ